MLTAVMLAAAQAVPGEAELKARLPEIFTESAAHYKALDAAATRRSTTATTISSMPLFGFRFGRIKRKESADE